VAGRLDLRASKLRAQFAPNSIITAQPSKSSPIIILHSAASRRISQDPRHPTITNLAPSRQPARVALPLQQLLYNSSMSYSESSSPQTPLQIFLEGFKHMWNSSRGNKRQLVFPYRHPCYCSYFCHATNLVHISSLVVGTTDRQSGRFV